MSEENVKYEYKIENLRGINTVIINLDKLSEDGWELVTVVEDRHYFKRKIEKKQLLD